MTDGPDIFDLHHTEMVSQKHARCTFALLPGCWICQDDSVALYNGVADYGEHLIIRTQNISSRTSVERVANR